MARPTSRSSTAHWAASGSRSHKRGTTPLRSIRRSMQLDDVASAIEWFRRVVGLDPYDSELAVSLAEAQLKTGDRSAAEGTLARGLEKNPDNAALLALGRKLQ